MLGLRAFLEVGCSFWLSARVVKTKSLGETEFRLVSLQIDEGLAHTSYSYSLKIYYLLYGYLTIIQYNNTFRVRMLKFMGMA